MMRRGVIATAIAFVITGCSAITGLAPAPQPCEQLYSVRRCLAMADAATAFTDKTRDDVAAVMIVPEPTPEVRDGVTILQTRGGAAPITVRLVMRDGTTLESQMCGGIPSGPACHEQPQEWETHRSFGGYRDVPCAGEPPDGCATPLPSIDPTVQASAARIVGSGRTIAIDHVGRYEVPLGTGSLPNGILTEATYRLADPWPVDVTFSAEGAPRLEIRSLEPNGRPFQNAYEHGWREGLERIEAVLVFAVRRFDPGASLEVVEVEVR